MDTQQEWENTQLPPCAGDAQTPQENLSQVWTPAAAAGENGSAERAARRKSHVREVRRRTNKVTAFTGLYLAILSNGVAIAGIAAFVLQILRDPHFFQQDFDTILSRYLEAFLFNGWGYLLAAPAVFLMVFLWKRKLFFRNVLFASERRMTPRALFFLMALFFLAQAGTDLFARGINWLLHFAGMSVTQAMEGLQTDTSVSMLLYVCIAAPFIEELFFRGAAMRSFQTFGKHFAIVASAVLFALIHGSFVQIPFAFAAGLILGWTAVEYGVWWSIFLHFFNNCILAELIPWLCGMLPGHTGDVVSYGLIYGIAAVALVLCIVFRKQIAAALPERKPRRGTYKGFFTSPVLLVLIGYATISSAAMIALSGVL